MDKMAICNRLAGSWAGWRALALINIHDARLHQLADSQSRFGSETRTNLTNKLQLTDGLLTDQLTKRSRNRPLVIVIFFLFSSLISGFYLTHTRLFLDFSGVAIFLISVTLKTVCIIWVCVLD